MPLLHRAMQPRDVHECVELIASHPRIGPQYGLAIDDLRSAWLHLLGREAVNTVIFEESHAGRVRIEFVGFSVCVHDNFIKEMKSNSLLWFGPELARRVLRADSPVLTNEQVRQANSSCGLNCLVWAGYFRSGFEQAGPLHFEMMNIFVEAHRGFLWKEVISPAIDTPERLLWTLNSGGMIWSTKESRYVAELGTNPEEIIREPHVVGITRELESKRPCSWVGALFRYRAPIIGFNARERHLLLAAMDGLTDLELVTRSQFSLASVEKTWLSIYERVNAHLPDLLQEQSSSGDLSSRGKEKRRRLLGYLRGHPEELRPFLRKRGS